MRLRLPFTTLDTHFLVRLKQVLLPAEVKLDYGTISGVLRSQKGMAIVDTVKGKEPQLPELVSHSVFIDALSPLRLSKSFDLTGLTSELQFQFETVLVTICSLCKFYIYLPSYYGNGVFSNEVFCTLNGVETYCFTDKNRIVVTGTSTKIPPREEITILITGVLQPYFRTPEQFIIFIDELGTRSEFQERFIADDYSADYKDKPNGLIYSSYRAWSKSLGMTATYTWMFTVDQEIEKASTIVLDFPKAF